MLYLLCAPSPCCSLSATREMKFSALVCAYHHFGRCVASLQLPPDSLLRLRLNFVWLRAEALASTPAPASVAVTHSSSTPSPPPLSTCLLKSRTNVGGQTSFYFFTILTFLTLSFAGFLTTLSFFIHRTLRYCKKSYLSLIKWNIFEQYFCVSVIQSVHIDNRNRYFAKTSKQSGKTGLSQHITQLFHSIMHTIWWTYGDFWSSFDCLSDGYLRYLSFREVKKFYDYFDFLWVKNIFFSKNVKHLWCCIFWELFNAVYRFLNIEFYLKL